MEKVFKTVASSVIAVSMLASLVPAAFADGDAFNRDSLQQAIKGHLEENLKDSDVKVTYEITGEEGSQKGTAKVVLDADTDVRESGKGGDYQDAYISSPATKTSDVSKETPLSLTGDFKSTLYMEPVRKAFEAFRSAAADEVKEGSALSMLLPTVPVKGNFTIDVIYDEDMQIADKDKFLKAGTMEGFNETAKEIFTDVARRDVGSDVDSTVPAGYRKFSVDVEVKAPATKELQGIEHNGSWANTLVYADLDKSYETLLADISFELPSVTVSTTELNSSIYYTESIEMTGSITIGNSLSTIEFATQQLKDNANNYAGVTDWQKISATMALLRRSSSSTGSSSGPSHNTASTPKPNVPTVPPLGTPTPNPDGSTPEPGSTSTPIPDDYDPNNTPAPGPSGVPNVPTPSTPKPFVPTNSTVPSALNGEDHMVYVIGYPEGDVRPLRSITREEIATIFYRLLTDEKRDSIYTKESGFDDVLKSRWSNKAIATMANGKYILGDAGTANFRPADAITRAEMAAIVSRFLDTTPEIKDSSEDFNDINGHWAATAIKEGVAAGWLTGYEDNSFKPDQLITRAEAMTVINRMLVRYVNADGVVDGYYVEWPDNPKDAWYYYNVIEATCSHEYEDRTFATPDDFYEKWTDEVVNWIWGEFKTQYEDPDEIDKQ
ncbi:MAG: S-layer homology domain-containing protein [bacterium]|nr:S-layer homology domain-containing protein [bacterium]